MDTLMSSFQSIDMHFCHLSHLVFDVLQQHSYKQREDCESVGNMVYISIK